MAPRPVAGHSLKARLRVGVGEVEQKEMVRPFRVAEREVRHRRARVVMRLGVLACELTCSKMGARGLEGVPERKPSGSAAPVECGEQPGANSTMASRLAWCALPLQRRTGFEHAAVRKISERSSESSSLATHEVEPSPCR